MPLPPSAARLLATASLSLCCLALPRAACGAERATISLDLTTESGFPINGAPEWNRLLGELGVSNMRIHSGQSLQVSVEESTSGRGAHRYRVLGVLHANGQLELPGGSFRSSDRAGLKRWLDRLNDQGKEGVTVAPGPFGLLPSQLEQINDDLEQPVAVSTGTLSASRAVQAIGGKLKYRLRVDRRSQRGAFDRSAGSSYSGPRGRGRILVDVGTGAWFAGPTSASKDRVRSPRSLATSSSGQRPGGRGTALMP